MDEAESDDMDLYHNFVSKRLDGFGFDIITSVYDTYTVQHLEKALWENTVGFNYEHWLMTL